MPSAWSPPPECDGRLTASAHAPELPRYRRDARGRLRLPRGPVVVLVDRRTGVCARPASILERIQSHLRGHDLDEALAEGACPEGQALLALRAQQLASPAVRRETCRGVERLLRAEPPPGPRSRAAPTLQYERIEASRPELEQLRDTLAAPTPVSVRGVAMIRVLLTDGGGPLFRAKARADLRTTVLAAIHELVEAPFGWSGDVR